MTTGGPTYIPHLRQWITWEYDTEDWPFVPLTNTETKDQYHRRMISLGYVIRYGQHWLEVPQSNESNYLDYHKQATINYLNDMAALGYWDVENQRPIPKPIEFKITDFPKNALMAYVMYQA